VGVPIAYPSIGLLWDTSCYHQCGSNLHGPIFTSEITCHGMVDGSKRCQTWVGRDFELEWVQCQVEKKVHAPCMTKLLRMGKNSLSCTKGMAQTLWCIMFKHLPSN